MGTARLFLPKPRFMSITTMSKSGYRTNETVGFNQTINAGDIGQFCKNDFLPAS